MGVVNVTPDSFSDGGRWFDPADAIAHGEQLVAQGAQILDIGGESTRPGAERPSEEEEARRVVPVVRGLAPTGVTLSVDTMRASIAEAALEAGAHIINDVSAGLADAEMGPLAAATGVPYIAMHWRGHSADMQSRAVYGDVVAEVRTELEARLEELFAVGVRREQVILDPGYGFAKLAEHNWRLLAHLDDLVATGYPVLVGTSRKTFLGRLGRPDGAEPVPPAERDAATAATSMYAAQHGAWAVRVHDVAGTCAAFDVLDAIRAAG
ncbi:MAG: dihydropteroate synthase [Micrococcales bacterium]|nr:dihydropteroate synthase [Micrococcales bacterium]